MLSICPTSPVGIIFIFQLKKVINRVTVVADLNFPKKDLGGAADEGMYIRRQPFAELHF